MKKPCYQQGFSFTMGGPKPATAEGLSQNDYFCFAKIIQWLKTFPVLCITFAPQSGLSRNINPKENENT